MAHSKVKATHHHHSKSHKKDGQISEEAKNKIEETFANGEKPFTDLVEFFKDDNIQNELFEAANIDNGPDLDYDEFLLIAKTDD